MSEMINPYIAGAPVTEKTMFFGRQDVFDWVQRSLTGKFVDHILVIHGQRRIGKTSVLKQIPFHLPATYVPVFFDLQGRTHTSLARFLWRLAKEITRTLRAAEDISLPELTREEFSEDPELFQNQLLPQISQAIGDRRLLLIFDEFDSLEEPTAREMLTQDLIPYLSRLMHAPGPLAFIFCIGSSGRKLEHMQASYTDFFRIALYRKISFLEKEEAARLITQPAAGVIEYAPEAVEDIFGITSGHPYFTQLVCHELFGYCQKTGKRRIVPHDVEAVLDDVVERGTVNLKFVWDDASDPERYVLTALSVAEDGRNQQSIHTFLEDKKVRISPREVGDSLRHLEEKDVLAPDNTFTVDLMRLWLLENKPLERVIEELIEVSPIATRYIEIAGEFREAGNQEEALDSYRRALGVDRQNLAAQVGIASITYEQGDLPQAVEEYQKALDIDPEDIGARSGFCQTHMALGDQLRAQGRVEEALQHYRQVLKINDQHLEAQERLAAHHAQVADGLRAAEKFDEAIEAFSKALEFTPEDPAIAERLAETQAAKRARGLATLRETAKKHFRAEKWEEAIASFEEYLSLEPEEKAAVQAVEARLAEAREQGELAATYSQAQAALNQKRYDEAAGLFKEIIDRDVGYKDALRSLTQAVELQRRAKPIWKDIRVLGGAGAAVAVIIAILLFRFVPGLSQPPRPATPTEGSAPTEAPVPIAPATEAPRPLTPTPTPLPIVRTLTGHSSPVSSVVFSPDGQSLASGSQDNMVILWDVESGQQVRQFSGMGMVHSLAFSPDGQSLVAGATDSTVTLWRVADGTRIGSSLGGGANNVASVAFSPDGQFLAMSGSHDGVQLRRVSDMAVLRFMQGHEADEQCVVFSPDGKTLAAGDWLGRVILWDVESGQLVRTLQERTEQQVLSVAFSPDGQTLASGSADETVILWDLESGERLRTLRPQCGQVYSVVFSPDGRTLALGHEDGAVTLWDAESGQKSHTLKEHQGGVSSVAFSPDGRILASGSDDATVMLWDVEAVTAGLGPPPSAETPAALTGTPTPPATTPTVTSPQATPTPLPPTPTPTPLTLRGHTGSVNSVAFSPDGTMLASGSGTWDALRDTTVRLWLVSDGALLRILQGHTDMVESVAFSPDGTIVASGSRDNTARLWRVSDGTLLRTFEDVGSNVALSPDGATLAEGGGSSVILWDVETGQQLRTLPGAQQGGIGMNSVAFAPGGQTLAAGWDDGAVRLWRVGDGALLRVLEGHTDQVNSIAFSPDGVTLASASDDQTVRLWRVSDGTLLRTVAEMQYYKSVAFSPDGALLAIAAGGEVFLSDVETGKQLRSLEYHESTSWVESVAFSPDGRMLASGWADGTIVVWSLGR